MAAATDDVAQPTSSKVVVEQDTAAAEKSKKSSEKDASVEAEAVAGKEERKEKTLPLPSRALNPMEIEKLIYSLMEIPPGDFEKRLPKV